MSEALALSGIDALYGESHVLHEVSFTLNSGKVLALLGRNGAGKTTCMSSIIGFLPPRRGDIRFFGESISRLAPEAIARKGVGFVPQGRRIFPTLTVRENLLVARQTRTGTAAPWTLERVVGLTPRYLAAVNADTFQRVNNVHHGDAAVGAVRVGETRLIDNIIF